MQKPKQFRNKQGLSGPKFNGRASVNALYNSEWDSFSKKFLSINNKCYSCGKESQAADHVIPHKGDEKLFWKEDNVIPLCHSCHNYITTKFDRNYRVGDSIAPKMNWIMQNRIRNELNFKVFVLSRKES